MPKFRVGLSQLRWEHVSVTVEAESAEAAEAKVVAMDDAGELVDWGHGDTDGDMRVSVTEIGE